jgi:hypothetical protein
VSAHRPRDYLLRRLAQLVDPPQAPRLIFVIARVMPGDPVRLALGPEARAAIDTYRRHRAGPAPPSSSRTISGWRESWRVGRTGTCVWTSSTSCRRPWAGMALASPSPSASRWILSAVRDTWSGQPHPPGGDPGSRPAALLGGDRAPGRARLPTGCSPWSAAPRPAPALTELYLVDRAHRGRLRALDSAPPRSPPSRWPRRGLWRGDPGSMIDVFRRRSFSTRLGSPRGSSSAGSGTPDSV